LEIVSLQVAECTALIVSSAYGHEGCVRLLLDSKAAVNATDVSLEPALLEPVPWDRGRVTSDGPGVLLQINDKTALHRSACNGHLAVTKLLLEGGADPTLRAKDGRTALDYARSNGRSEVVALLSEPRYAARMHFDRWA
jgi:ankyrin repeat protein